MASAMPSSTARSIVTRVSVIIPCLDEEDGDRRPA